MRRIKVQTISDIITNSSSEVFCRITSSDTKLLERIQEWLTKAFGYPRNYDSDISLTSTLSGPSKMEPTTDIYVRCPLSMNHQSRFFYESIEALLERDLSKEEFDKLTISREE